MLFADEAGNFDFSRQEGASQYFILTTVRLPSPEVALKMANLRWELAWQGYALDGAFHAATDRQVIRNRVFAMLGKQDFRIDATILEKSKTLPRYHQDPVGFYQLAWWLHWKHVAPRLFADTSHLLIVAGTLSTKKKRSAYEEAVVSVVRQVGGTHPPKALSWPDATDPGIQIADYCAWAIQRKWERGDSRSYDLVKSKISTEFPAFASGTRTYY